MSVTVPVEARLYLSLRQLTVIHPFCKKTWERWVKAGYLPGAIRKNDGRYSRLLIPLDEADRLVREGRPAKVTS